MEIKKQDIGVWVRADIDPPKPNGRKPYRVRDFQEVEWVLFGTTTKRWDDVFEWLKPFKDVYVLTEEEIKNLILAAVISGQNNIDSNGNYIGISAESAVEHLLKLITII